MVGPIEDRRSKMEDDAEMPDADGLASQQLQNYSKSLTEQDLDEKYPNRPRNHGTTFPFHTLYHDLFDPLMQNRQKPAAAIARKKQGPHGPSTLTPNEARKQIIERFIAKWRKDVGHDIFPAFRLILPDRDRERSMYGLKEKTIAKLLIKILRIDNHSDDAVDLLNWKLPGQKATSRSAGDFAQRCLDVLRKRTIRTEPGDMTVLEVNQKLDELSLAGKETDQKPILEEFYNRMNAMEMHWLIRMVLRQMKIGATEKTFFDIWHPDAETLFNISSNLRRVCWELYDPGMRLVGESADVTLMQCFQPQLAQFQMQKMEKLVQKMRPTEEDPVFWVEEKLDGERMQLHMIEDPSVEGGKKFGFWSRKAKDYTYLYGNGLLDDNSALTRHLRDAFHEGVRNIILDGEMITWDPVAKRVVGFGTLKTAALSEQKNPFGTGERPVFKVFDILLLNDVPLLQYTLRDRRNALVRAIKPVVERLEIHTYEEKTTYDEVETMLHKVIQESSEGLVLKNPRSTYRLNERNDDWMKVKPEYMTEYGEDLDCLIVGGYYGSGRRGGGLSSFMCALRYEKPGNEPMKFYSFFKVGGGMNKQDYDTIHQRTEGKWRDWNPQKPPTQYIELGGTNGTSEKPDVWIRPDESIVVSVKAAAAGLSNLWKCGATLRFPRFKALRPDKDWKTALSVREFYKLKMEVEEQLEQKKLVIDESRKKRRQNNARAKKPLVVAGAGNDEIHFADNDFSTNVFAGLSFFIMCSSKEPVKKDKPDIEAMVKHHGGAIYQTTNAAKDVICIADRPVVTVASLEKRATQSIFKPIWLFDCIEQARRDMAVAGQAKFIPLVLPFEEKRHVFFAAEKDLEMLARGEAALTGQMKIASDTWHDGFARDVGDIDELRQTFADMPNKFEDKMQPEAFIEELHDKGYDFEGLSGWLFQGHVAWFDGAVSHIKDEDEMDLDGKHFATNELPLGLKLASNTFRFASGTIANDLFSDGLTHIIISSTVDAKQRAKEIYKKLARYSAASVSIEVMLTISQS
jgi:DNA ligase-4